MSITQSLLILFVSFISIVHSSHFRGGTITWRPLNNTPSGSTVDIQVRERFSWNRATYYCDATTIAAQGIIGSGYLVTYVSGATGYWINMNTAIACTDFSAALIVSSGEHYETHTIPIGVAFSIGFVSSAWFANLVVGGNGGWSVINRINTAIRPDGYINSSPVAVSLPIIYKQINILQVHVVQMSDFDGTDTLKCRWSIGSTINYNGYNECSGVCNGIPGASLISNNCTIVFTLTNAGVYAAVALQIEDYYNSAATTPMSSVPLQFLFYGYAAPTGNCTTPPAIIGNRPNRACIGTPIGSNVTEYVIVQVYCPGTSIVDFVSSSPTGMTKSVILNPSTNIYEIILSWVPVAAQYGPQPFCAGAVDNKALQSNQWCITFLVGFESPSIIRPSLVQGSASPIGTVFQNQTVFSIQTTMSVSRPTLNGTYIYFTDATTNTLVQKYDCGWELEVTYTGFTTIIRFPVAPWIPGHFYYVTFDSGVASGTDFCGPESAPVTDPTFWVFNIWDPSVSSTTTTTTTYPTTHTITSRGLSTSTTNPNLTTTGIVITTTTAPTTTATTATTTISTTTAPTTAGTTATTGSTASTVGVMYPKDFEKACLQPIVIMTVASMVAMVPIQALAMFAAFTKFSNMFDPKKINARVRHQQRMKNIKRR